LIIAICSTQSPQETYNIFHGKLPFQTETKRIVEEEEEEEEEEESREVPSDSYSKQ